MLLNCGLEGDRHRERRAEWRAVAILAAGRSGNIVAMEVLSELSGGAPVAGLLLAALLGVGLLGLYAVPGLIERSLFRPHWLLPNREFETLASNGFVHADLGHLLFNAFTFWSFGFGLERAIGSGPFAALYGFGLLAGDAGTWLAHRHDPDYRSLGASGAIMAVLFASIVYQPSASIFMLPIPIAIPAPIFAGLYLAYTVFAASRGSGRINHDAHLSGALAGIAFVAGHDPDAFAQTMHRLFG